jgi:predicted nucleotidyltransferase
MDTLEKLNRNGIPLSRADILTAVGRYGISVLSVFGSSIRDDFLPESDIDLLVEFRDSESISLFDIIDLQTYFEEITKRPVDIVEPSGLRNPFRRKAIIESREILYAAE